MVKSEIKSNVKILELKITPLFKIYSNNNYHIYQCHNLNKSHIEIGAFGDEEEVFEAITVTGDMYELILGSEYYIKCTLEYHKKYGEHYNIINIWKTDYTIEDEKSLLSKLVKSKIYNKIIHNYERPITAILEMKVDYEKLMINKEDELNIIDSVVNNIQYIKAMDKLSQFGISFNFIKKIVDKYGCLAIKKVIDNPYILIDEISGIGFIKADFIASQIGIKKEDPKRINAGILYALDKNEDMGNSYGEIEKILINTEKLLDVIIDKDNFIFNENNIYIDKNLNRIAKMKTFETEKNLAKLLNRFNLNYQQKILNDKELRERIADTEIINNYIMSEKQKEFIQAVNENSVIVLTGYAGTGKTVSVNFMLNVYKNKFKKIKLLAPTNKAAKVLTEKTGIEALTIHKAIGFKGNLNLDCDLLVVEEASMVDIFIFNKLLMSLSENCKIIIIGDTAQLESIRVGNILNDIINSGIFKVIQLTEVFRQALDSGILKLATEIRNGEYNFKEDIDYYQINQDTKVYDTKNDSDIILPYVLNVYKKLIESNVWFNDIMVISPIKKGSFGVHNLNINLREIANSKSESKLEVSFENINFRVGDKVRHTKNEYDRELYDLQYNLINYTGVFNGDFGIVCHINNKEIFVNYGNKIVRYIYPYKNLELSYAITVHSAQGSQAKFVISVIDSLNAYTKKMLLKRSLLYTAVTRAEKWLMVIGSMKQIKHCIRTDNIIYKKSFLKELL